MRINFRFILLGVLVGILSTIGYQELSNRYQPAYPEIDPSKEALQSENTKNISSGSFREIRSLDGRDEEYVIVPRDSTMQQMRITKPTVVNSTNLNAAIRENNHIQLLDTDLDGVWDERVVPANQTRYFYGKEDGFPVYIKTTSNEVVRIDGSYHSLYRQEGKKYIVRDGDKLEVDFTDMDEMRLTPLFGRESDESEQLYTEVDIQNYQTETNPSDITPLAIPLTQEMDDELIKQGILPPREK
jgi:hypothetical protein